MDQPTNLDVAQMQAELAAQSQQGMYGDYQSNLTSARAAYGDVPAMMMSGAHYAGAAGMGAAQGMGNLFSTLGSRVMPVTYTPPARVSVGYYGQYQQETGFFRGLGGMMGLFSPPRGVQAYQHGYYNAADFGERMGGGIVAGANVMGATAAFGLGSAVGTQFGGSIGALLGPMGMKAGAVVGGLGVGMLAYEAASSFGDVVAQRRQMNAFLDSSSFRYVGAGSTMADVRLGGGMSASARRDVTDFARQMDIRDPSMSTEDIFNTLQGATNLGMFSGTRDAEDFKRKFKDIVEGVKVVSKTLNTTLQEGLQVMKDLRSIAVDPSQMGMIMSQANVAGKISGRTGMEVVNLGLQGAELFRGTGVEMKIGYQSNVMNIAAIRSARDAGLISQEAVSQAGGEEALAQRLTASGLGFMQSAAGRGFGAQFFSPGAGPGGFNRGDFMNQMMRGDLNYAAQVTRGAANLSSPSKLMEYEAYQDKFMSEMGKAFGGDTSLAIANAAMAEAKYMSNATGTDTKTSMRWVLQKSYGMSTTEADTIMARVAGAPEEYRKKMEAGQITMNQRRMDEAASTRGLGYLYRTGEDYIKRGIEPLVGKAEGVIESVKQGSINLMEKQVYGMERMDVRGLSYLQAGSLAGGLPNVALPALDLDKNATAALPMYSSVGRNIAKTVDSLSGTYSSLKGVIREVDQPSADDIILEKNFYSKKVKVISRPDYAKVENLAQTANVSDADIARMEAEGTLVSPGEGRGLFQLLQKGTLREGKLSVAGITKAMYGKTPEQMTKGEWGALRKEAGELAELGIKEPQGLLEVHSRAAQSAQGNIENISVATINQLLGKSEDLAKDLSRQVGLSDKTLSKEVANKLALARNTSDPKLKEQYLVEAEKQYIRESGGSISNIDEKFRAIVDKSNTSFDATINPILNINRQLSDVMSARGGAVYKNLIDLEVKSGTINAMEGSLAVQGVQDILLRGGAGLMGLSTEESVALGKTTAGRKLLAGKEVLIGMDKLDAELEKAKQNKNYTAADGQKIVDEHMKKFNISDEQIKKNMSANYLSAPEQARQIYTDGLLQETSSKTGVSAPGAGSNAGAEAAGTFQGSATEQFERQMNVNLEVLTALENLNRIMRSGGR